MLSKRISSIGLFIVSEMTENPSAKYVKFRFCVRLSELLLGEKIGDSFDLTMII